MGKKDLKNRRDTGTSMEDSKSSSSSSDGESRRPFKMTQIFIGAPPPGQGGCIQNGAPDMTQEEWCSKYCKPKEDPMRMSQRGSTDETVEDGLQNNDDTPKMTQDEWCTKYCSGGRARRQAQGRQAPSPQPQIVYLPTYQEGCRKNKLSNKCCNHDDDKKKVKKGEEAMTPEQQYMTFLQGYALAAAVMMAGPPPRYPQQYNPEHQQYQDCRICPKS